MGLMLRRPPEATAIAALMTGEREIFRRAGKRFGNVEMETIEELRFALRSQC
jgi:hypothetical protein